jgi:hypothetical protein
VHSTYQAFAFLWHVDRGDYDAARLVASLPQEYFAPFDRVIEAAFVMGMAANLKE